MAEGTAPLRFCTGCGKQLGAHSISVTGHPGAFHYECVWPLFTPEERRQMAEAPIYHDHEPGQRLN